MGQSHTKYEDQYWEAIVEERPGSQRVSPLTAQEEKGLKPHSDNGLLDPFDAWPGPLGPTPSAPVLEHAAEKVGKGSGLCHIVTPPPKEILHPLVGTWKSWLSCLLATPVMTHPHCVWPLSC